MVASGDRIQISPQAPHLTRVRKQLRARVLHLSEYLSEWGTRHGRFGVVRVESSQLLDRPLQGWNVVQGVPGEHGLGLVAEQAHRLRARDAGPDEPHGRVAPEIMEPPVNEPGPPARRPPGIVEVADRAPGAMEDVLD